MSAALELEPAAFRADFDRRAFRVRHGLVGHPLLSLDALVTLARELPKELIEYNAGDLPIGVDPAQTPGNGLSAEETVRRIHECRSWLALKRVERVPEYAALLERCLAEVRGLVEPLQGTMQDAQAFVFVSSPGAVTPFHMDPELNFLLQIQGDKTMRVWSPDDREVISDADLEGYFSSGQHRNLVYRDAYAARCTSFRLAPGDGLHVPMAAPHWVQNGEAVSVSLSITFRTDAARQRERLYQINARLRQLGLTPAPVGGSRRRDSALLRADAVFARARTLRRALRV